MLALCCAPHCAHAIYTNAWEYSHPPSPYSYTLTNPRGEFDKRNLLLYFAYRLQKRPVKKSIGNCLPNGF